jgi:hypothetical protein
MKGPLLLSMSVWILVMFFIWSQHVLLPLFVLLLNKPSGVIFAGGFAWRSAWCVKTQHTLSCWSGKQNYKAMMTSLGMRTTMNNLMYDTSAKSTFPGIQLPKKFPQKKKKIIQIHSMEKNKIPIFWLKNLLEKKKKKKLIQTPFYYCSLLYDIYLQCNRPH